MPVQFLVICEAEADFRIASQLAERVLCRELDWLQDTLESCPIWQTTEGEDRFVTWKRLPRLAEEHRIRLHGEFKPGEGRPYAHQTRRALLVAKKLWGRAIHGIILLADSDHEPERRDGMEQAVGMTSEFRERTVIALAHPCREAWVLAGFQGQNPTEHDQLATLRDQLGFHPCEQPEKLNSKHTGDDPRSAKRVLKALTGGDFQRESNCWSTTPLEILERLGKSSGLTAYLHQVQNRFCSFFQRTMK